MYSERCRDAQRRPSFSSMLFTLVHAAKAEVRSENVFFGKVIRKNRQDLADQYRRPRTSQEEEGEEPVQNAPCDGGQTYSKRQAKKLIQWFRNNRSEFIGGKNGILIHSEYDLPNGRIRFPLTQEETKTVPIYIENKGSEDVTLKQYKVLRRLQVFSFEDEMAVSASNPLTLAPGDTYKVLVHCLTQYYGYFPITLVFEFNSAGSGSFSIGRFLSGVSNSKLAEELRPTAPYTPYQTAIRRPTTYLDDEGVPPDDFLDYELERDVPLGQYNYPMQLKNTVHQIIQLGLDGARPTASVPEDTRKVMSLLSTDLQFAHYKERFQLLLQLEEIQMEVDIRRYDQTDMSMMKDATNKRLLVLAVPGVAENRPSVLRGDHLFVTHAEQRGGQNLYRYKGYVHAVELEKVKLGFSHNLLSRFIDHMKFDVTFTFNRLPLRVQHRAVELAVQHSLKDVLFPSVSYGKSILTPGTKLRLFDRNLENNQEQYKAVDQIVNGCSRPAPYLIFGPPGTGKTVTLVEAIKQILECIPTSHVLACAPSNSAADLLCERLLKHRDKRELFRLNASSRDFRIVPEVIKPCCNWDDAKQCHVYPNKEILQGYRVIITTLVTAGRLVSANFPRDHFSHVFIDESGHAVEPECVTAIAGILSAMDPRSNTVGGQLVLAGDPKQLGPILRSPVAIKHGLDMSLLERLMTQNSLYQKHDGSFNPVFVTKLLRNYRSHPAILKIPNELFYDGELQEFADKILSQSYCNWEHLPKKGFPIVFEGVLGEDQREEKSPSFFNLAEVETVVSYLKKLLINQGKKGQSKLSPKEIGIISPYRKQVEKIRQAITKFDPVLKGMNDIKDLKVGSVEEFQGQERRVVIISMVRSCTDYVKLDEDFNLGFLKNPKRFNVAITRAKALLIVVGNPIILNKDPNWGRFLKYCCDNGGYAGFPYQQDNMEEDELAAQLGALDLSMERPDSNEESLVQQQQEPEWRHDL
ncbi:helicase MOV-10 isoform X2 [Ambystoma mexicanum]|uniref:helicase MOV-10 isoform X2 n=1 Tax=Ambystoma mexicanum TaxID=8296 RepID=UPI0037E9660F